MAKKSENYNPYMQGRFEWNERYGNLISRERRWRIISFICLLITLVSVGGVVYIGSQSKFIPYIVEVDKLGRTAAVSVADKVNPSSARIKKAALQDFISNVRTVYVDAAAMRKNIDHAYALIPRGGATFTFLNDYFANRNPFYLAQTETISIELKATLPVSENSWQIEWIETRRARKTGELISQSPWKAVISIEDVSIPNEKSLIMNPASIMINGINWTEIQ